MSRALMSQAGFPSTPDDNSSVSPSRDNDNDIDDVENERRRKNNYLKKVTNSFYHR